ncbi:sigma-70 family RNA polymerase sigma factor [Actinomycetospora endophytica]|uniref:sigma-70 family RNA polymerase sigma factor n=1 Tax=Actinomycetospora endophytica TaxID=2291215 RepID=UPI0027E2C543|nr:sigma-70 family RNA polymerase sigma factor [Actinomycetospora endophytica]
MSGDQMDPRDLDRLVASALAGERGAMDTLLRILRPLVVRYCRSRLGGYDRVNATPDDVAQEVCLAVLRALPGYQDQGRPFLAFVYGIAQHKVVDAHRAAGRDRSDPVDELPEGEDLHDGPEQHALAAADSNEMAALMGELPEKQREVLRLRVVVGLSAEETAEAVGSTAGAVRVAQHRALTKLRQLITERGLAPPSSPDPADDAPRRRGGSRGPRRPAHARPEEPAVPVPDWQAAPRTGDIALDRLLDLADAHVAGVARDAEPRTGPVGVTDRTDQQRRIDAEDARMAGAARRFRGGA